jgi:uncharacterized membrane protein YhhN
MILGSDFRDVTTLGSGVLVVWSMSMDQSRKALFSMFCFLYLIVIINSSSNSSSEDSNPLTSHASSLLLIFLVTFRTIYRLLLSPSVAACCKVLSSDFPLLLLSVYVIVGEWSSLQTDLWHMVIAVAVGLTVAEVHSQYQYKTLQHGSFNEIAITTVLLTFLSAVPYILLRTYYQFYGDETDEISKPIWILALLKTLPAMFCAFTTLVVGTTAPWFEPYGKCYYAFLLCALGDVLLQLDGELMVEGLPKALFVEGLLAFLVAHIFFIQSTGTWDDLVREKMQDYPAVNYGTYIVAGIVCVLLSPQIRNDAVLRKAVPVYAVVLATLVNRMHAMWKRSAQNEDKNSDVYKAGKMTTLGAILFMTSDLLIALHRFEVISIQMATRDMLVEVTYFGAIGLLTLSSLVGENDDDDGMNRKKL